MGSKCAVRSDRKIWKGSFPLFLYGVTEEIHTPPVAKSKLEFHSQESSYDYLIVGAGFAGTVLAERLASQCGKQCLVIDRRAHLAGNAYDPIDENGVRIHAYGPHYFRTNSSKVKDYLSQFTDWHEVNYEILSYVQDNYWPFPVNLNTFEKLIGRPSTPEEMEAQLEEWKKPITNPQNFEDVMLSQIGSQLYEMFYQNYTQKQWQLDPKELDSELCERVPLRTNRDDRYLNERFQALPKDGYENLFRRMLEHPLIDLRLTSEYREVREAVHFTHLIFTGPLDEYFNYCYGPLPYRSLRFEKESFTAEQLKERESIAQKPGYWQPAMQVNYPNDKDFTRIVEIKHATGQQCDNTTIVREYPQTFQHDNPESEPYYPVPTKAAKEQYAKYKALAEKEPDVTFVGRLATYRYYNMDQVIAMALTEFDKLRQK